MLGVTRDEGSLLTEMFMEHIHNITVDGFKQLVNKSEKLGARGVDVDKVTDFYLKGVNTTDETALQWAFYRYAGDVVINCPTYLFGQQFAQNVAQNDRNVYFYEFTYANPEMSMVIGCDQETMGICHAIDIFYVFGLPYLMPDFFTAEDFVFSRYVMKLWTDFAKYGKPDNNWPKFLTNNTINIKDLNPFNTSRYKLSDIMELLQVTFKIQ
ncbi:unnamed protein product, partial [Medioppia subpectinata]